MNETKKPLIVLRDLVKKFGRETAVDGVSLDIYDREFLALLGPSGCGKTTLLRMLGGFENPTAGTMSLDGEDLAALPPNKRPINMVFQSYAVFPHLDVRGNVAYGLEMERLPAAEIARRTEEGLALVRMESFASKMPHQLSGGQRQRVALARALVKRPRVLLLDEPLSALDAKLREAMQAELVKLQHAVGVTFVVVTHDQDEALSMAERVAVMEKGVIRQLDTPRNLYEAPQNRFVADFIGRMNIFSARHAEHRVYEADGVGRVQAASSDSGTAFVAVRPAYVKVVAAGESPPDSCVNVFPAAVESVSYYGGETVLAARAVAGATFSVVVPNKSRDAPAPAPGANVTVCWRAEDMITLSE